jgi:delta14-sterol reductase
MVDFSMSAAFMHAQQHRLTCPPRLGFKLIWGCLVFYPFFYPIGVWNLVSASDDISIAQALLIAGLFFFGWMLTRGANLQKYVFKVRCGMAHLSSRGLTVLGL